MKRKTKVNYMEYIALRNLIQTPGTVANLIDRYLTEMESLRPVGESQRYSMLAMQRRPIAAVMASALTKSHVITDCQERSKIVCAATVMHDTSNLSVVLKYAGSAWADCEALSTRGDGEPRLADAAVVAAKPFLSKNQIIGKSAPRKRRPTDEEIEALLAYFNAAGKGRVIRMPDLIAFALVSTRRLGEICRITHGDVNAAKGTYWVRDVKHPTLKKGNHKEFALFPELAAIIDRQPRIGTDGAERVFPFNAKSCSAAYTLAKKRLGIEGLRFHDSRREAITRWLKKFPPHKVRQISGHETSQILERVYDAPKPEELLQASA